MINLFNVLMVKSPFTKKSLEDIYLVSGFKNVEVDSFKQLPILWSKSFIIKTIFSAFSEITRIIIPDYFTTKSKWVRFSKGLMLLSYGIK